LPPRLISVNVGLPRDIPWRGQTVHTGIWKNPVEGPQRVRRLNIDGDGQGDLGGHGGPNRAVMVYQLDSFRYWEHELGRVHLAYGQFGENFTVEGLPDDEVCIGDRFRIGTALFEVSQPRVTCYRLGMRMENPQMASLVVAHHRPGFYFRVLEEGEIAAGDEIVKIAEGPEHLTVAEADAMLYLHAHTPEKLQRALRIPALAAGWQSSFKALLEQDAGATPAAGNAGLAPSTSPPPAWPGFRSLKISRIVHESASVRSFFLTSTKDDQPLVPALPGQFVTVRIHPAPDGPSLSRNYSLSGPLSADHYRISVKLEPHGAASTYLHQHMREGDPLEVAAPRGSFTLQPGARPVVLLSAGVGATPVMSMLHALAAAASTREIWWLFGARNGDDHPFAAESRALLQSLPHARSFIGYSRPAATDQLGTQFDAAGRLTSGVFQKVALPRDADFYLCGPVAFTRELTAALESWGVNAADIHSETFGPGDSITPGVAAPAHVPPHQPAGATAAGPPVAFARSGLTVNWDAKYASLLELAEACDVPVRWACRTGVCHTCESALISGTVIYNPDPLDPPAPGNILICCARPKSELAMDL
jgi:ferredoxin-NADP reductase/MOSC domain-containing protein YiiM